MKTMIKSGVLVLFGVMAVSLGATRASAQCAPPLDTWTIINYRNACMAAGFTNIVTGTAAIDFLFTLLPGPACFIGFDGADTIVGTTGDDCIYGGLGGDSVFAGDGQDRIFGGAGSDVLSGQNGHDLIYGGDGDDNLVGVDGNDTLHGEDGDDTLSGGAGRDNLYGGGGTGAGSINGGADDDYCETLATPPDFPLTSCNLLTYATLGVVDGVTIGGVPAVRFTTTGESGTQGFEISRLVGIDWIPVGPALVRALLGAPQGGTYYVADSDLTSGAIVRITEVEVDGERRDLGTHAVIVGGSASVALSGGVAAVEHPLVAVSVARPKADDAPDTAPVALYLGVGETGVYRVTMTQLAASLELTVAEARQALAANGLALSVAGDPVAWWTDAARETLYFYGESRDSLYIADNLYRLELGTGSRATSIGAAAASGGEGATSRETVRAELDVTPVTVMNPAADTDFWFWQYLAPGVSADFPITLVAPVTSGQVQLTIELHGATTRAAAGEHAATLLLNGVPAGTLSFEGIARRTLTVDVDASALVDGVNTLRITGAGAAHSIVWVDAVSATYTRELVDAGDSVGFSASQAGPVVVEGLGDGAVRVVNVSNPHAPVLLTGLATSDDGGSRSVRLAAAAGARYIAVTDAGVRSPRLVVDHASNLRGASGAEYLVIAPREVFTGARALAAYRAEAGFSTMLVDLDDVFDEFAHGTPDPRAIRAFLAHATSSWSTPPRYVVLAGAGTYDYRDVRGLGGNLVPPLMVNTDDGLFASDSAFSDFDDDSRADLLLGRLPVTSNEALEAFVARLGAYEAGLDQQTDRTLFVAGTADYAGFERSTDALATLVGAVSETGLIEQLYRSDLTLESAREQLFGALADGVFWVNYIGHGALNALSGDGILTASDVSSVTAAELAIFTNMTCQSSRFEIAGFDSFGETLSNSNVAIGVWGATGLSTDRNADVMVQAFARGMYGDARTLGEAIDGAYVALAATEEEGTRDMFAVYHLLGDPATRLKDRQEAPIIVPPADLGTDRPIPSDAGADLGAGADAGTNPPNGGGGCSTAVSRTSSPALWLGLGLVALLVRRRRR